MAAQWPLVKARLLAVLPTLSGWSGVTVFNASITQATLPNNFAAVGYVPNGQPGSFGTTQHPNGYQRVETGTVHTTISCWGGGTDVADPEARTFALYNAVEDWVRASRQLNTPGQADPVLSGQGTSDLEVAPDEIQAGNGAAFALIVSLNYTTVT